MIVTFNSEDSPKVKDIRELLAKVNVQTAHISHLLDTINSLVDVDEEALEDNFGSVYAALVDLNFTRQSLQKLAQYKNHK